MSPGRKTQIDEYALGLQKQILILIPFGGVGGPEWRSEVRLSCDAQTLARPPSRTRRK